MACTSSLRESTVERYLNKMVKDHGGLSFKFVSPGHVGVPDRILVLAGGEVVFVEVKSPTGRLSLLQKLTIKSIQDLGARVEIVHDQEEIEKKLFTSF